MQPQIRVTKTFTEDISIDQLANWFWMLEDTEKIEFFNSLAEQTQVWFGGLKQCEPEISGFIKSPLLSEDAKYILSLLSSQPPKQY